MQNYLIRKAAIPWVTNGVFHNLTLLLLKIYDKKFSKNLPRGKMIFLTTDVKLAKYAENVTSVSELITLEVMFC